jgi:hypothetical protein
VAGHETEVPEVRRFVLALLFLATLLVGAALPPSLFQSRATVEWYTK